MDRRDLQRILTFALEAGTVRTREEFACVAVDGGAELVAADIVSYNDVDEVNTAVAANPRDVSHWNTEAFNRHIDQHPLIDHYRRTGDGRARKFSDFVTIEELHELDIYREFFAPLGIEHQLAVTLPAPRPALVGLAFSRGGEDFEERDREVLNTLRPHLAASHRRIVEREELQRRVDALERGLDEVSEGVVLVAPDGTVEHVSARGRELLGGNVPTRLPDRVDGLHVRRVGGEADTGVVVISRDEPPETHGLTPRELEVLASIADGLTAQEVGTELGISRRTVEDHLANVYEKLGVRTQAGAVARVFGVSRYAATRSGRP